MKRKVIFFMTILCLFMISSKVNAEEISFYEAEKLDNIYTKSVRSDIAHFQKARFFRRKSDNKAAYCIEPFEFFDEESKYTSSTTPNNIDSSTWRKMSLIAHYGYGYKDHTDSKWYAITQLLIWREKEKDNKFFFTNGLNGERIEKFTDEINEIYELVNNHDKLPSFSGETLNIKKGTNYIVDSNNVINGFISSDSIIQINEDKVDISKLNEGHYKFIFKRKYDNYDEPVLFYYNSNSQDLMTNGYVDNREVEVTINIYDTNVVVNKIDSEIGKSMPQGEGKLCDCTMGLYNSNKELIEEFKPDNNCRYSFSHLDLGKYYIKEIMPGKGYLLNDNFIEFNLTLQNTSVNVQVANEIIKKEVTIHKDYGTTELISPEEGAIFQIYSNDKVIHSIKTDKDGNASITLPYGKYVIKQASTLDGYINVDDFSIDINDNKDSNYNFKLMDYKIDVPDTRDDQCINYWLIILSVLPVFYVKKIVNCI